MSRRRIMLITLAVALVGSMIGVGVLSQNREARKPLEMRRQMVTSIPPTFSKVKTLEVLSTQLIVVGNIPQGVAVEIRNNSDKAVMAVDLVSGEGAITKNGLTDAENPKVVIEPYGTVTMHMSFGEMTAGAPLVVAAATYADGTEEGAEESLAAMHAAREHDKEKIKADREKAKGDQR